MPSAIPPPTSTSEMKSIGWIVRNVEVNRFTREITMQPWPGGSEHDAQENCANRQHNQRHRHHTRTFVRVLGSAPAIPEKE